MAQRRPQDLVFTLFGDYLLQRPGAVWVGALIAVLGALGVTEGAARTTLSRMSRKGWLDTRRDGRRSFYTLTPRGRRLLEHGAARIYHPPRDEPWDGLWSVLAYSIPEDHRHLRDRLRVRLSWLGFGSLGNGLWISPRDARVQVEELAAELGIKGHIELFRAEHLGWSSRSQLVAQAWDLPGLDALYRAFMERHRPRLAGCVACLREGRGSDRDCFVHRFRLVHEYREFPLLDPYLPGELLPRDWHGEEAAKLFERYHDALGAAAERYMDSVLETMEETTPAARAG